MCMCEVGHVHLEQEVGVQGQDVVVKVGSYREGGKVVLGLIPGNSCGSTRVKGKQIGTEQ